MKLNINSTSAQLYRWFYATPTMPQSLCPYFWKLVIMWLLILPYSIISLPIILMDLKDPEYRTMGERVGMGFILWFCLGMLGSILFSISLFWYIFPQNTLGWNLQITGIILLAVAIVVGSTFGILLLIEKYKKSKIKYDEDGYRIWHDPKEKESSIIVEFIKASYNKYCPKIDWDYKK